MIDIVTTNSVVDLNGRRITGDLTIRLRPGIGVIGPKGEHLEGGPHTVPVAFAMPLISSNRAAVVELEVESISDPSAAVQGAPAGVQQRDPAITNREGPPTRKNR